MSIAAAIEEAVKSQDLEFSTRSRSSTLSSLSTVGDCGGPCCAGELELVTPSITAIPLVAPVPSTTTAQSINAAPPVLATQSSTGVFSADALSPTATTRRPAKRPIGVSSVPHSLFTFQVQAPGTVPSFKNAVLQDRTNTMGGSAPFAPDQPSRKRRRRTPKEGEPSHQAKRLKRNPPVRTTTRKDRKEGGRIKQAAAQAVYSTAEWTTLGTSRTIEPPYQPHTLEDVLLLGLTLVSWDGV
jgi:hypothetical protein